MINFEQSEYKNAATSFESIPETPAWNNESEFRLVLVYLQLEELEKAKVVLKRIAGSDAVYSEESQAIMGDYRFSASLIDSIPFSSLTMYFF